MFYYAGNRDNQIFFCYFHNGNALCGTAHFRNVFYFDADDDAVFGDGHNFFIFFYDQSADDFTVAFAWTYGKYPFAASCLLTIFIHIGTFAIAIFGYY